MPGLVGDGPVPRARCDRRTRHAGAHYVRANNTLVWKTVEFEAGPGEDVGSEVVNRSGFGTKALVEMLGVGTLYLTVRRITNTGA